ncbi:SusC/RagA family TonB-linked outer membrane protein [Parapedobacter sp. DT-150]|uniref:SusC/RagA family TonB-linked outer membrane protein n=1 Tax=Parapedobacter sp. DT-150 TaxID=3396162 RepID=UPI003F1D3A1A
MNRTNYNQISYCYLPTKNKWLAVLLLFLFSFAAEAVPTGRVDQKIIKGLVKDQNGVPLPGVTVTIKNSTTHTTTDENGSFILDRVQQGDILVITSVGYSRIEVTVGADDFIDITIEEDQALLDEVVVVGYGQQKKQSVIGSIVQTTDKELKRQGNQPDLAQALTGQLPGIVTLTSSGEPGGVTTGESATNIFIRGKNTWNGGQPLILVDGVERAMNNIDVNEVASVSVLKDASATAVFGVKGANGVILITTKRGMEGKTQLNFNYTAMGMAISKLPQKLDSYAAMMAKNEIIEREGVLNEPSWNNYVPYEIVQRYQLPQTPEYAEIYPNVDWQKAMFKDVGFSHKATLNARGGNQMVQYFGSLAYLHEGDMFQDMDNGKGYEPNYNFDRFNFRSNIDIAFTKRTKMKLNLAGFYGQKNTNYNNEGSTSRADAWMWRSVYGLAPNLYLPMYSDGRWGAYQEGGNNTLNPLAVAYNLGIRQARYTELNSDFHLEQDLGFITEGLSAVGSFFYDNNVRSEGGIYDITNHTRPGEAATNVMFKQIYPMLYKGPDQDPNEYTLYLPTSDEEYDWIIRPWTIRQEEIANSNWIGYIPITRRMMYRAQLKYARQFNDHNVTAMGLFQREESARGSAFKTYREDWVFRATYDYKTRYLLEVNGAYNGSEKFGPGYRFDFFPSLGMGWYLSNEPFFKVNWVDALKFRYSIGMVGDDSGGGRWLYASQYAFGTAARLNNATDGQSPYTFYREETIGNPNVHWETATKQNLGLDLALFKNVLTVTADIFNENRTNILIAGGSRNVPPFFGTTPPAANLGQVKSKGYELEVGATKRFNPSMTLWGKIAITHNENTVIFRDDPPLQYDHIKAAGYPIDQRKSLINSGFYTNWDEVYASVPTETNDMQKLPGYYDMVDFNADGVIKANEDAAPIGYSGVPQKTLAFTVGFDYKGFSMMAQLYGASNATRYIPFNNFNYDTDIVFGHVSDYWSMDNPDASSFLPRWKTQAENIGNYYVYDASFLRLQNAEIGYSFSKNGWINRIGLDNLRVFVNGTNLFFWSDLPDDREGSYSGGSDTEGSYPNMRRFNVGIDVSF